MSRPSRATAIPLSQESVSWLSLLTSTTLGSQSRILRVEVHTPRNTVLQDGPHRLIVQLYDRKAVAHGKIQPWATPRASAQRSMTQDDLNSPFPVHLFGFQQFLADPREAGVVVAWVESGLPDLELDGIHARPTQDARLAVIALRPGQQAVKLRLVDSRNSHGSDARIRSRNAKSPDKSR